MESIDLSFILAHWPFFVVSLLLGVTGAVVRRAVILPTDLHPTRGWRGLYYVTMPLHPAAVGGLLGTIASMPCPEAICTDTTSRVLYYAAAGMLSSYVYAAVKHIAKARLKEDTPQQP